MSLVSKGISTPTFNKCAAFGYISAINLLFIPVLFDSNTNIQSIIDKTVDDNSGKMGHH